MPRPLVRRVRKIPHLREWGMTSVPVPLHLLKTGSLRALRVWGALSEHATAEGLAWPSQRTISECAGVARSNVQVALTELEAGGFTTKVGPVGRSTVYRLSDLPAGHHGPAERSGQMDLRGGPNGPAMVGQMDLPEGPELRERVKKRVKTPLPPDEKKEPRPAGPSRADAESLADAYARLLPMCPQVRRPLSDAILASVKSALRRQGVEAWVEHFARVAERCPFLRGEVEAGPGREPFRASLVWLLGSQNQAKVEAGNYDREPVAAAQCSPAWTKSQIASIEAARRMWEQGDREGSLRFLASEGINPESLKAQRERVVDVEVTT